MSNVETQSERNPAQAVPAAPQAPEFAVATAPSYPRTLFLGPDGLRPGWGFAFYVLMFYAAQRLAVELAWARDLGASGLWSGLLEEFGNVLAALIPAVGLARVEGRPWRGYGLPPKDAFGRRFRAGIVWGISAISLLMFALYALHAFSF